VTKVSSKLFKVLMRYCGNNTTLSGDEGIKIIIIIVVVDIPMKVENSSKLSSFHSLVFS